MALSISQALSVSVPATAVQAQAAIYYQWLRFCCQFTVIDAGGNWSSGATGNDGIISIAAPTHFYTVGSTFTAGLAPAGDVGKYIAIRDPNNAINTVIGKILTVVSDTEVTLENNVVFTVDATAVSYVVFDADNDPPAAADYFVIENPVSTQPKWHAVCTVSVAPATIAWQLGPSGGWDPTGHVWTTALISDLYYMLTAPLRVFCVSDPAQGWFYTWAEDGANINAVWLGSIIPFHASGIVGIPQDESYALIFGTPSGSGADVDNVSRDTLNVANFCTGEAASSSNVIIPAYMCRKLFLLSGNDSCTVCPAVNPRSGEQDDYEVVVFHAAPDQAFRGKLSGVKLCNDAIVNRTLISTGTTYVIENGIGSVWNGKLAV